jgi:hypothetical protein
VISLDCTTLDRSELKRVARLLLEIEQRLRELHPSAYPDRSTRSLALFCEGTTGVQGAHTDNISMSKPEHGTSRKYTLNRLREQRLISWATLAKLVISLWYEI